jgi:hypothetical protein
MRDTARCPRPNSGRSAQEARLELLSWVRSLTQSPDAVIHSPAEIVAAWRTTLARSRCPRALIPQHAEAGLSIVEGDPLNNTGEHFRSGWFDGDGSSMTHYRPWTASLGVMGLGPVPGQPP